MALERIVVPESDQQRLFLETAIAAGQILTEREVDCHMDITMTNNKLTDQQYVIINGPGSAPDTEHEFELKTRLEQEVSCFQKTTSDDGVNLSVTERRLGQREGGMRLVTTDFLNRVSRSEEDTPADLGTVGDMLQDVGSKTAVLRLTPEFSVRALPRREGLAVPAAALVPLVGQLIETIGKALLTVPEGRIVDARFKVAVNSTGKVYDDRPGEQLIKLSVIDKENKKEAHFTLLYSFGTKTPREEYSFVESSFRSRDRSNGPEVYITEGLQQHGDQLVVVRSRKVGKRKETETSKHAPNDSIATMAGRVVELLT